MHRTGATLHVNEATKQDGGRRWRELYRAAMMELDPESLVHRTVNALAAMARRLSELQKDSFETTDERREISEAISSLEYWRELRNKHKN